MKFYGHIFRTFEVMTKTFENTFFLCYAVMLTLKNTFSDKKSRFSGTIVDEAFRFSGEFLIYFDTIS